MSRNVKLFESLICLLLFLFISVQANGDLLNILKRQACKPSLNIKIKNYQLE